jgi:hypothetical protein
MGLQTTSGKIKSNHKMADKWTPDLPSPLVCKYSWSLTERECDIICFLICLCTQVRRCIKGSYATGEGYNSQIVLHGFFLVVT